MIRAISGKVFVRREALVDSLGGMFVGDSSAIKNYAGEVVAVDGDAVAVGDRVLLPNFGTSDVLIDGEELAHCDVDELLCVWKDDDWRPLDSWVKTLKCVTDHCRDDDGDILIYIPDNLHNASKFVEILDIGDKCVFVADRHIGKFIEAPEYSVNLQRIPYTEEFLIREKAIRFVV